MTKREGGGEATKNASGKRESRGGAGDRDADEEIFTDSAPSHTRLAACSALLSAHFICHLLCHFSLSASFPSVLLRTFVPIPAEMESTLSLPLCLELAPRASLSPCPLARLLLQRLSPLATCRAPTTTRAQRSARIPSRGPTTTRCRRNSTSKVGSSKLRLKWTTTPATQTTSPSVDQEVEVQQAWAVVFSLSRSLLFHLWSPVPARALLWCSVRAPEARAAL